MGILRKILGSRPPARDANARQMAHLGGRIAATLFDYMKLVGAESFFDPATLIVLKTGGEIVVFKRSPGDLPFKEEVVSFVALKDLPVLDRCRQLMGDGSHFGAVVLGLDLLSRSILERFLRQGHHVAR